MAFIRKFHDIGIDDISSVGGKTASLGQMITHLSSRGIRIPDGFAITSNAYWHFIEQNELLDTLKKLIEQLDVHDLQKLSAGAAAIGQLFIDAYMPDDLAQEIIEAYKHLSETYNQPDCGVAVRSSATAEDLPGASFAGQQETFLHIQGAEQLLKACQKCFASLFTDRAIVYRFTKGFDHFNVALSIAVQKMVQSDAACSGVAFSLDTETGFKDLIVINGSYGLGEAVVQGVVNPDEFYVFKTTLQQAFMPIVQKKLGTKKKRLQYCSYQKNVTWVAVEHEQMQQFCLKDQEIIELSGQVLIIEDYYSQLYGTQTPMDIEWAKDVHDGFLYIVQARPETVHAVKKPDTSFQQYCIEPEQKQTIAYGQSIGKKIVSGAIRIVENKKDAIRFNDGDILVTYMTDPDWVPLMQKASGIITEAGGRTCHAAIVSRELGIPAVIGVEGATKKLTDGQLVTLDCSQGSQGFLYEGAVSFRVETVDTKTIAKPPCPLMVNVADPASAFSVSQLPYVSGVGLARVEFIIAHTIRAHPMAFVKTEMIRDPMVIQELDQLTAAYASKQEFFIDSLAQGVATIAAAFYPRPVIVRFSDFKTNEYHDLLGGKFFEPAEHNPMLGLRGASRYYNPLYEPAFALECAALKKAREYMGLTNIIPMIPFVRTVEEAWRVITVMRKNGLVQGVDDLKVYMMVEIPSNVLLIDDFCKLFDGFSIGSNDLTQMTLAVDRDSALLAPLFDERDKAVKKMCSMVIEGVKRHKKPIGICGQAPSDYPEFAQFLIEHGIDSLSLNPDSIVPFLVQK